MVTPVSKAPTLETERLRLRSYRSGDFDEFARMWQEPEVIKFFGGVPIAREASWTRFLRHQGVWQTFGFGYFAIEDKATGALVGECGFQDLRRDVEPSLEGTMEAGWGVRTAYQRKGLAFEAVTAILDWADAAHPGQRITCLIDAKHAVSQQLALRLGFEEFARTTYVGKPVVLFERRR
jgi:RimJ/RimL family protein N-acetyltransferase